MASRQHKPSFRNLVGWAGVAGIVFTVLGIGLWVAGATVYQTRLSQFASGFLSNLAAESLGIGFSTLALSAVAWLLNRQKSPKQRLLFSG